jgi:hypothetical protein
MFYAPCSLHQYNSVGEPASTEYNAYSFLNWNSIVSDFFISWPLIDSNLNLSYNIVNENVLRIIIPTMVFNTVPSNFMLWIVVKLWEHWFLYNWGGISHCLVQCLGLYQPWVGTLLCGITSYKIIIKQIYQDYYISVFPLCVIVIADLQVQKLNNCKCNYCHQNHVDLEKNMYIHPVD